VKPEIHVIIPAMNEEQSIKLVLRDIPKDIVIHPYPTQAEAIRQTGDLYNRTRLTPFVKKLFERILSWRR